MENLTCQNKRCKHNFYSSENEKIIKCPICNSNVYNMALIVTPENVLWIETMIKNIERYGENTFQMIDKVYHNAKTRARVREIYFKTVAILED